MQMEFENAGQDFKKAGEASFAIKHRLKLLGIPPDITRRVATASYEAELNVIVYARKGRLKFHMDDHTIWVTVTDIGPGIPNVNLAMQEGYTTAPPYVKQLGYGSGMGLPNIKENADWMDLRSVVNQGTILQFKVHLSEDLKRGK
jgi:anti-sigma regulatory factor (Ser/Thr protein kinase)